MQNSEAKAASETKPEPSKNVINAVKSKRGQICSAQIQGLESARDVMGDSPLLDEQRAALEEEIENLRKLKLDKNLGS